MSYRATVYNLMISCPSDAEEAMGILCDCINDWNIVNAEHNAIILLPLFHKTYVPPNLANPEDARPQAVINEDMLPRIDWLIAIFKNRIGTPTGKADSGTLEEIDLFRKTYPYRPISVYFFEKSTDEKLGQYKTDLAGIWKTYKCCDDLARMVPRNLSQIVYRNNYIKQKFIDTTRKIEQRAQILIAEMDRDANNMIKISKFVGQELKIETNGYKFIGYDEAFEYLLGKRMIEQNDDEGRTYILTVDGKQELKTVAII